MNIYEDSDDSHSYSHSYSHEFIAKSPIRPGPLGLSGCLKAWNLGIMPESPSARSIPG